MQVLSLGRGEQRGGTVWARSLAFLIVWMALLFVACTPRERDQKSTTTSSSVINLGTARAALVTTESLDVSGDTYLQSGSPNQNLGGDTHLSLQSSGKHRSLLFFDTPSIASAVGNGTLVSARVELTLSSTGSNWGSGRPIAIHPLKQASSEYQATWNCAHDVNLSNQQPDCSGVSAWSMNSADPAEQPWLSPATATALITSGQAGVVSFDVTADVASVLAGTSAAHGWLVKKVDEDQNGSLEFASRELGPAPRLLLEIDGAPGGSDPPGPVTGSAMLAANADSHVRQGEPNQNHGSDNTLRLQASGRNRALVGLDAQAVTTALGGPLVKARLRLPIATTFDNWGPDRAVGVHRLRRPWAELGATWNCAVDANPSNGAADCSGESAWSMSGATEELAWLNAPTATALVSNGQTGTLELDVTRDVACALAGHAPLQGWLVKKAMESQSGRIDLHSRETAQAPSVLLEWTDGSGNGVVVSAADCAVSIPPGGCTPSAPEDITCNAVDDDCDGVVDDDFAIQITACGVGVCSATGETSCVSGQVVDDCSPSAPAPNDESCNGSDDDCNGVVDEDYAPLTTSCGVGACSGVGETSCVLGQAIDSCQPGAPAPTDASCNGSDDDCDGASDEDFVPSCAGGSVQTCVSGTLQNLSCSDGNACNGEESCSAGQCQTGTPPELDDDNTCTLDFCDPIEGVRHIPVSGASCADGDVCNGAETCDIGGNCQPGGPPNTDDGNPCTADSCNPVSGVSHAPVAAGTSCADGNVCNGAEACDAAGACGSGTALVVNDGNPCTADSCDPASGVAHTAITAGTSCGDADLCNGAEACDGGGTCLPGQPLDAGDQNPCTVDSCDPVLGVTHEPAAAGTSCSDGSVCNGAEVCNGSGVCESGLPVEVDDGDPCTADGCSDPQGVTHTPVPGGTACEDGDVCNGTETCTTGGTCAAGTPLSTGGGENPCVIETSCDPISGLEVTFEPTGTACGQGFICDGAGSCLRDQGGGTPAPPLPPGAANGITVYGLELPRDAIDDCVLEALHPDHVAVITGTVVTWDPVQLQQVPVPNARVSIPDRCVFGVAWTLSDGTFRYPINGGEQHMIRIEADADGDGSFDYLPVERAVESKWRASVGIDDVELVLPAPASETLELIAGTVPEDIVLNGPSSEDDRDGDGIVAERTPSVLFKSGTVITGVDANGASVVLNEAAIRMTEYTVGAQGTQRMPAPMPPGTGYGYAIELSIDGVDDAFFDQPAVFYVDNFLGAEAARSGGVSEPHQVGLPVPAWYYDRHQGAWVREDDGIIIRLVGVDGSSPPQAPHRRGRRRRLRRRGYRLLACEGLRHGRCGA